MLFMKRTLSLYLAALILLSFPATDVFAAEEPVIEETVLVDESDIKITATELEITDSAAELTLVLENNTDKNLSFHASSDYGNAVNSYMVDSGYLNADVSAGKKSREKVRFDLDELFIYGITDISSIEMGFYINDDDHNDYLQTPPIHLDTSLAGTVDEHEDTYLATITSDSLADALSFTLDHAAQDVLYDVAGVQLISETLFTNQDGEREMLLEFENTSDAQVIVRVCDITINGLRVQDGSWTVDSVNAGKRRVTDVDLSYVLDDAYSEVFGITDIASITFTLRLLDAQWNNIADPQTVQITIPNVEASFDDSGEVVYDENGIQIISKGLAPDNFELSDDIHALFLVKNNTADEVDIGCANDSVSVNGFMNDEMCFGSAISPSTSGILDVELYASSLSDNGCDSIEDIEELELTITIGDNNYHTLAEPVVTLQFDGES